MGERLVPGEPQSICVFAFQVPKVRGMSDMPLSSFLSDYRPQIISEIVPAVLDELMNAYPQKTIPPLFLNSSSFLHPHPPL